MILSQIYNFFLFGWRCQNWFFSIAHSLTLHKELVLLMLLHFFNSSLFFRPLFYLVTKTLTWIFCSRKKTLKESNKKIRFFSLCIWLIPFRFLLLKFFYLFFPFGWCMFDEDCVSSYSVCIQFLLLVCCSGNSQNRRISFVTLTITKALSPIPKLNQIKITNQHQH